MYKFTYPAEKFDESNLDKTIILTLIKKHQSMVQVKAKNKRYYEGKHAIESRKREQNAPNNKVVCNHAKDIADTASGYFMGNSIKFQNTGKQDIEVLLKAFDAAGIDDVDFDNALDMSILGVAYEYVYVKEGETIPISKNLEGLCSFMIYDDTIEENELCGVYYYPKKNDVSGVTIWVATVVTKNFKYVLNIEDNVDIPQTITEIPEQHYFGDIPMIEYKNNKDGIGDFEQQISLIDAYNILMSDRVNDKEQFIDALLVLYGAILGDDEEEVNEATQKLRQEKLLELPLDAKAEYLTRQMDENGAEILRKALKEDIYTFSHVPNLSDENFAGNSSGVAMEYKLLGLEMITKVKERHYKKGIRKRIQLYCNYLNMKALSLEAGSIMASFSRSLPKNLQELAQIIANLSNHVSERTLISLLPFVEDPEHEIEVVEEQKQQAVKQQQELFKQGANTPPDEKVDVDNPPEEEKPEDKKSKEETKPKEEPTKE